jgi:hypothetical protein
MPKFRKKPVVIEAVQWTGDNFGEVAALGENVFGPYRAHEGQLVGTVGDGAHLEIKTLEGRMRADLNDWIIKGVNGEVYPCKPDIFEKSYEPVTDAMGGYVPADAAYRIGE